MFQLKAAEASVCNQLAVLLRACDEAEHLGSRISHRVEKISSWQTGNGDEEGEEKQTHTSRAGPKCPTSST